MQKKKSVFQKKSQTKQYGTKKKRNIFEKHKETKTFKKKRERETNKPKTKESYFIAILHCSKDSTNQVSASFASHGVNLGRDDRPQPNQSQMCILNSICS